MSDAIRVNPQNPTRTKAPEMCRRGLDCTRGYEVITVPMVVYVFVKGGDHHPISQTDRIPFGILARVLV